MTHMRIKLTLAGVVFVGALAYLGCVGMEKGWTSTLSVDTYLSKPEYHTKRIRLCGKVGAEQLEIQKSQLTAKFLLLGQTQNIKVLYHGVVPDLFKAGGEVLVEGKRDEAGIFVSDLMMTKCASKYEEAPAGHPVHPAPATQAAEAAK
ncbi:MAG: cytochrome c maturation protein CcmE [Phycisphaerae bacterium]